MQQAYTCSKPTAHSGLMKTSAVEGGILQDVGIAFVDWQMKYKHHVRKLAPHRKPGKCGSEPERAQGWVSESIHYRSPEVQGHIGLRNLWSRLTLGKCNSSGPEREKPSLPHRQLSVSHCGNFNSQGLHRLTTAASFTHSPAVYTPPTPSFQPYTQPSCLLHPHPSLLVDPGVWIFFDTVSPLMHSKLCEVNFYFWKRKLVFHSCQRLATLKIFLIKDERECWLKTVNKTEAEVFSKSLRIEYVFMG